RHGSQGYPSYAAKYVLYLPFSLSKNHFVYYFFQQKSVFRRRIQIDQYWQRWASFFSSVFLPFSLLYIHLPATLLLFLQYLLVKHFLFAGANLRNKRALLWQFLSVRW